MSASIRFVEGALPPPGAGRGMDGANGAKLVFEGIVRGEEAGRPIRALRYEAYRPMADRELERLALDAVRRFGVERVEAEHGLGEVPVGGCSFRLTIHARHRQEALAAAAHFIDAMKRDAPIWKQPCWSEARGPAPAADRAV